MVLQVRYGDLSVSLGNELTPTQVKNIPAVHWNADDGSYYLLCMTGVLIAILTTLSGCSFMWFQIECRIFESGLVWINRLFQESFLSCIELMQAVGVSGVLRQVFGPKQVTGDYCTVKSL